MTRYCLVKIDDEIGNQMYTYKMLHNCGIDLTLLDDLEYYKCKSDHEVKKGTDLVDTKWDL